MPVDEAVTGATTEGIPVAPSMASALESARVPPERTLVDRRVVFITVLAVLIALARKLARRKREQERIAKLSRRMKTPRMRKLAQAFAVH